MGLSIHWSCTMVNEIGCLQGSNTLTMNLDFVFVKSSKYDSLVKDDF